MEVYWDEVAEITKKHVRLLAGACKLIEATQKDKLQDNPGLLKKYKRAVDVELLKLAAEGIDVGADEAVELWGKVRESRGGKDEAESALALETILRSGGNG